MPNAPGAAGYAARWILVCVLLALLAVVAIAALPGAKAWAASPGGLSAVSSTAAPDPGAPPAASAPPGRALLVGGRAVAPLGAPPAVKRVIAAANRIRTKPYVWGGGHGRWWDRGYDCSGAVSYALHGGELLDSPLPSGPMMRWGSPGRGRWITIYAHGGHAFAVIAGLRWDTSGNTSGTGPRWHAEMASTRGFVARHPAGY
jgi:cell wall-associated NlpC family hydrolase